MSKLSSDKYRYINIYININISLLAKGNPQHRTRDLKIILHD